MRFPPVGRRSQGSAPQNPGAGVEAGSASVRAAALGGNRLCADLRHEAHLALPAPVHGCETNGWDRARSMRAGSGRLTPWPACAWPSAGCGPGGEELGGGHLIGPAGHVDGAFHSRQALHQAILDDHVHAAEREIATTSYSLRLRISAARRPILPVAPATAIFMPQLLLTSDGTGSLPGMNRACAAAGTVIAALPIGACLGALMRCPRHLNLLNRDAADPDFGPLLLGLAGFTPRVVRRSRSHRPR